MAKTKAQIKAKLKGTNQVPNYVLYAVAIMALIFGSLALFSAEPQETIMSDDITLKVEVSSDFGLKFLNGTDLSPKNESFKPLGLILSVLELDDVLLDAYEKNMSGEGNLNELLDDTIVSESIIPLFIGSSAFTGFCNDLSAYIFGSKALPSESEIADVFTPVTDFTYEKVIGKPFAVIGFTLIIVSDDFNISDDLNLFEGNSSDLFFFSSGLVQGVNITTFDIPTIIASDFFENSGQLSLKFNEGTWNMTDLDNGHAIEYDIDLDGTNIVENQNTIPVNLIAIINELANLFSELA